VVIKGAKMAAKIPVKMITSPIRARRGIYARDYPIVQGAVLIIALTYVAINLFVDITYKWLDPRIKLE